VNMIQILKELCFEVTNQCTMACRHCSTRSVEVGSGNTIHISLKSAKKVINDFAFGGGKVLEISGGEPLTYPHLKDIIAEAYRLGLEVRLYTSGIVRQAENGLVGLLPIDFLMLKYSGVSKIIFNLEGASPRVHQRMMGVLGTFRDVIRGITYAKDVGLWVGVHFVPTKFNVHDLPAVVAICSDLEVDEVAVLRFVPQGRGNDNKKRLALSQLEFDALLKTIITLTHKHPELLIRAGCPLDFLSIYDRSIAPHRCKAGRTTAVVAPDGNVYPCPAFKNSPAYVAGNIYKESLLDIWEKAYPDLRAIKYHQIGGQCSCCPEINSCFGRCAAQRFIANGSIFIGPDPGCPLSRNVTEIAIEN